MKARNKKSRGVIHFAHFGLESGMVFEGTPERMDVCIVSKKEIEIYEFEIRLEKYFVCALI